MQAEDRTMGDIERYERGKIALIRNERGKLWWRVTVYVGDEREDLDRAVDEALRIDKRFRAAASSKGEPDG